MRYATPLIAALIALGTLGCVQRTITITSNPTGALVHLNDEEVGRTPLTVPFTFYGTYDVRVAYDDARWMTLPEAQKALGVNESRLRELIDDQRIDVRTDDDDHEQVRIGYKTLWTKQPADAPWWEAPGPDLIAEMIPGGRSELYWHFDLQPAPTADATALINHAKQMRSLTQGAGQ